MADAVEPLGHLAADPTAAWATLRVHAEDSAQPAGAPLAWAVRRFWARVRGEQPAPARVRVTSMQGARPGASCFEQRGQRGLVDLSLPAGTYHVTVHLGTQQRGYTLTLAPGASVELFPCRTPERA